MFSPPKSNFDIGSTSAITQPPGGALLSTTTATTNSNLNNCSSNNNNIGSRPSSSSNSLQNHPPHHPPPVEHHIENNITESYKNRKNSLREVRNTAVTGGNRGVEASGGSSVHQRRRISANDKSSPRGTSPVVNNNSGVGKEQNMSQKQTRRNGDFHQSIGSVASVPAKCSGPVNGNNSGSAGGSVSNIIISGINHSHNNSSNQVNRSSISSATYRGDANSVAAAVLSGPDEFATASDVGNGANVGEVIVVTRPRRSRDRRGNGGGGQDRGRRRPSESEISSRTSHSTKSSFSTSSSSRLSGSGTPCHRGSSCSEAETSSTTSSSETSSVEGVDLPYPGFPAVSLKYLTQTTKPRNWCLKLITNPYPFSRTIQGMCL